MAYATVEARAILGIDVAVLDHRAALELARQAAASRGDQTVIHFLNAHNANLAVSNRRYRDVLNSSLVLADGIGVDIGGLVLHGRRFPANLNGTDFVPAFLSTGERPLRVALVGARPDVLETAADRLARRCPQHTFLPLADGYYDRAETPVVMERIKSAGADVLIVAMGSPMQELWVAENVGPEHARLVFSVGALFDFLADAVPRAPRWVRALRSEWIYRLWLEPGRLWRRYLLGNPLFLARIGLQRLGLRRYPR